MLESTPIPLGFARVAGSRRFWGDELALGIWWIFYILAHVSILRRRRIFVRLHYRIELINITFRDLILI